MGSNPAAVLLGSISVGTSDSKMGLNTPEHSGDFINQNQGLEEQKNLSKLHPFSALTLSHNCKAQDMGKVLT